MAALRSAFEDPKDGGCPACSQNLVNFWLVTVFLYRMMACISVKESESFIFARDPYMLTCEVFFSAGVLLHARPSRTHLSTL